MEHLPAQQPDSHIEIQSKLCSALDLPLFDHYYVALSTPTAAKAPPTFPTIDTALDQVWHLVSEKFKGEILSEQIRGDGHFILTLKKTIKIWKPSSKRVDDNPTNWVYVYAGNDDNQIRGVIESDKITFTDGFKVKLGFIPAIPVQVTLESKGDSAVKATACKISKTYPLEKVLSKVSQCKCSPLGGAAP
jgi:hypothetical protein